jgi:hypothetical protein
MGSSTTPPATRDEPPAPRQGASSAALRLVAKIVLGVAGFAGFALLGAGGAWLFKHYVATAPAAQVEPVARTRPEPAPPAAQLASPVAPPVQAVVAPAEASEPSPAVAAQPEPDLTVDAPTSAGRATSPPTARAARGADPQGHAAAARADRAACQARVNAITVDVSLRHEPSTPEQLAILKRGCR